MMIQGMPRALFFAGLATMFGTIMFAYIAVPGIVHWQITKVSLDKKVTLKAFVVMSNLRKISYISHNVHCYTYMHI